MVAKRWRRRATTAVQPVWWLAPSPAPLSPFRVAKDLAMADVDYVKPDLALRIAFVQLMAIIGRP
jgi:hypothetical protein